MHVSAGEGDVIPVPGHCPDRRARGSGSRGARRGRLARGDDQGFAPRPEVAERRGVDLVQVKTSAGRIEKADVLAYVEARTAAAPVHAGHEHRAPSRRAANDGRPPRRGVAQGAAARRRTRPGHPHHPRLGPQGAVLAADILSAPVAASFRPRPPGRPTPRAWRRVAHMAERMTATGPPRRTSTCSRSRSAGSPPGASRRRSRPARASRTPTSW